MLPKTLSPVFFLYLLMLSWPALAQAPGAAGPADIGRIAPKPEELRKAPALQPKKETIFTPAPVKAPPGAEKIKFTLKGVIFEDGSSFSQAELDDLAALYVGREVSLAEVYQLAADITDRYRKGGWILSRAIVPPQEIKTGHIRIKLVEGYIASVRTQGDAPPDSIVSETVEALSRHQSFNSKMLEKYVLLLNDLPGMKVKAVLEPLKGNAPENAIGLALIFDHEDTTTGAVIFDNFGSKYVGPYQLTGSVSRSGLFAPFGLTSLQGTLATQTDEMSSVALSHRAPLTMNGLSLLGYASYSTSEPGYLLQVTDTDSSSFTGLVNLKQQLIRSREMNIAATAQFDVKNIRTDVANVLLYDDRLRVGRLGILFDNFDSHAGANSFNATVSHGFDGFGARETGSVNLSRANGRSDFYKFEGTAARLQSVTPVVNLYMAVTGQYTDQVLLSSEQFNFGGQNFGRGYDPAEISGDSGMAASAEVRFVGPSEGTFTTEPFIFYDIGRVLDNDVADVDASAASAGGGSRFTFDTATSGILLAAFPLTRAAGAPDHGNGHSAAINFSLKRQF